MLDSATDISWSADAEPRFSRLSCPFDEVSFAMFVSLSTVVTLTSIGSFSRSGCGEGVIKRLGDGASMVDVFEKGRAFSGSVTSCWAVCGTTSRIETEKSGLSTQDSFSGEQLRF